MDPVSRPFVHDFTRRSLVARVASVRWAKDAGLQGDRWLPGDTSPEVQALLLKAAGKYLGTRKADHAFWVELKAQCAAAAAKATAEAAAAAAATGADAGTAAAAATGATTDQAAASSANPTAAAPSASPKAAASPLAHVGDTVVIRVRRFIEKCDNCKACTVCQCVERG